MDTTREKLVLSVVLALAFACRLDKLLETPGPPGLGVVPSRVAESAPAGSDEVRPLALTLSSGGSRVTWTAHTETGAAWLELTDDSGATPDTLRFKLNIGGLDPGTYRETIVVVPDDSSTASVRVPVELRIDPVTAPATRLLFSTQPTVTTAGAAITPAVQVRAADAQGKTVTTFTGTVSLDIDANPGGGTLAGNTNASAVAGVASFPGLSINKSGSGYTLAAHATGLPDEVSAPFAINPGAPDHLTFTVEPSNTQVNQPIAPAVQVTMRDINENVATSFTGTVVMAIDHDGSLVPPATLAPAGTQRAAAAGVATFENLRIDKVGVGYTLVASATGYTDGLSGRFDVTPVAGSATHQSFATPPSDVEVNQVMSPVRVEALDDNGARVTGYTGTITLALAPNPAALAGTTSAPAVNGLATFANLWVTQAGTGYVLTAHAADLPDVTSPSFTVSAPPPPPPPATHLDFTDQPPAVIVLRTTFSVTVTALNDQGGVATGYSGLVQLTLQGPIELGGLEGTTQINAVGGVARFTNLRVTGLCVGCSLVASSSGLTSATSSQFNVVAGQ
ncbi:MAG TPA: hypothetical protein VGQ06_11840 [Gemmatimonadales bacterium]|nr:hypothetical protein [Gemmatimonadales bacterium]